MEMMIGMAGSMKDNSIFYVLRIITVQESIEFLAELDGLRGCQSILGDDGNELGAFEFNSIK
ncbi:hypothetical protein VL06_10785 [Rossellomorea marisflavi]|uniref:Uncharacterized protein n=1 Tax=Rossellomorea marisflavi TaxID=189381 RepID=A0A0J5SNG1_9BACI|nr:hypothetical protein VL03_01995 [Rossellomorea marisflavi]KML06565.1 hypothetical protein VL06_10785 [Rossellomorea marisflavi]KML32949.1 hypothetical protein VL12_14240 [Rossellomorea marisflavi]KZE49937.1 hypothetical protein AV649_02590 [Rossellomorea marisflavi]